EEAYQRICQQLRELALEHSDQAPQAAPEPAPVPAAPVETQSAVPAPTSDKSSADLPLRVTLTNINEKDAEALHAEMAILGEVLHFEQGPNSLSVWLNTTATADDLEAVCCFIVNEDQVKITSEAIPGADAEGSEPSATEATATSEATTQA